MAKKLLMGNEAMAHAALQAGVRVVAGYPGTPSSEIVETVAKLHAEGKAHGVHVEWSTNEKAALEMLFGASLAGARCLFTCKQMGLNVASDALMSLNYVSVRGGLVLVVADDPGPISSQTEQDTRRFAAFAKVPVLDPATPEQAFDMVQAAFELSERYHTPVIVRPTTRVDHASAFFDVEDETHAREVPEVGFERDVSKWVIFPRRAFQAHGEINDRLADIAHDFSSDEAYRAFNRIEGSPDALFGIVASGISASYAREALRMVEEHVEAAGLDMLLYRFMQVGTAYPFPEELIAEFTDGLRDILVIEELDSVIEDGLVRFAGRTHAPFNVHGKLTGEAKTRGENNVDDIASRIEKFLGLSGRLRRYRRELMERPDYIAPVDYPDELPVRPPVLCPGCPHRGSFYAVKQALQKTPAVLCGDIGCYTLGNAQPLDAVDTCLCMGAGITMAQGLSIVDPGKKAVAFVGDSTFFASGMTGLANAAYNGHDITVMVLDNSTTAMTGSQPHPGTGITLMGDRNQPLSIESVLLANGFKRVFHANPLDKDASIVAAKAAIVYEGPSAVIFESPCIQLIRPEEPVAINADTCTGCKKCITEIGCPAIGFDPTAEGPRSGSRGQALVDPSLCNGCDLCTQVCPFHAIVAPPERRTGGKERRPIVIEKPVIPAAIAVPEPPKMLDALESAGAKAAEAAAEAPEDEPTEQVEETPVEEAGQQRSVSDPGLGEEVVEKLEEACEEPEGETEEESEGETEEFEEGLGEISEEPEEEPGDGSEEEPGDEPREEPEDDSEEEPEEEPEEEAGEEPGEEFEELEEASEELEEDSEAPEPEGDLSAADTVRISPVAEYTDEEGDEPWDDGVTWGIEPVAGSGQGGYKPLQLGGESLIGAKTIKDEFRAKGGDISSRVSSLFGRFGGKKRDLDSADGSARDATGKGGLDD